jgi:hypothetical protein
VRACPTVLLLTPPTCEALESQELVGSTRRATAHVRPAAFAALRLRTRPVRLSPGSGTDQARGERTEPAYRQAQASDRAALEIRLGEGAYAFPAGPTPSAIASVISEERLRAMPLATTRSARRWLDGDRIAAEPIAGPACGARSQSTERLGQAGLATRWDLRGSDADRG